MRNLFALAPVLMLAACTSMPTMFEQPPEKLVHIHRAAKARITYQEYFKRDWRYIAPGTTGTGNCAVFAMTVWVDSLAAGYKPDPIHVCLTPNGRGHAYTSVNGWALDNRFKYPIPLAEEDCKMPEAAHAR